VGAHSRGRRPIGVELTSPDGALAFWAQVVLLLALLALLAYSIYVAIEQPHGLSTATTLLQAAVCAITGRALAWNLLRGLWRSAADIAGRIEEAFPFLVFGIALVSSIGEHYGWTSGAFTYVVFGGESLLMLAMLVYWLGGKRRLTTAIAARAAVRHDAPPL
jgi:hypothetical protein